MVILHEYLHRTYPLGQVTKKHGNLARATSNVFILPKKIK